MLKQTLSYIFLFGITALLSCTHSAPKQHMIADRANSVAADSIAQQSIDSGFSKTLSMGAISFKVSCANTSSLNRLVISPSGIVQKSVISEDIEGTITDAVVADLNSDAFPELYCFANSAGSGSYGKVYAYSSNKNKSLTSIYLPELSDNKKFSTGYMGHDVFKINQNRLIRSFPIYLKDDPNVSPSGGTRTVTYKLKAGEAGWVLEVDNVKDSK
ncbi:PliI family lysozyme inhibitor of I-type lysozyme [Solitalea koreensis]|uniref:Lysozyme inhibitor of I-type lysozyme n=1 Tax=Solitalea koreensis TaxID=543615 RepID=A0A521B9U5_9SPHI|nr:PliI family lysozyme inhibitor of I-type lysozyme [Solitalea koreensis]SMO43837.1 lysozyme inhibitor of I-type lysozyme [Solitalea koreensis]